MPFPGKAQRAGSPPRHWRCKKTPPVCAGGKPITTCGGATAGCAGAIVTWLPKIGRAVAGGVTRCTAGGAAMKLCVAAGTCAGAEKCGACGALMCPPPPPKCPPPPPACPPPCCARASGTAAHTSAHISEMALAADRMFFGMFRRREIGRLAFSRPEGGSGLRLEAARNKACHVPPSFRSKPKKREGSALRADSSTLDSPAHN